MRRNLFHFLAILQILLILFAVKNVRSDENKDEEKDKEKDTEKDKEKEEGKESEKETSDKKIKTCGAGYTAECVAIGGLEEQEEEAPKDCTEYKVELVKEDQKAVDVNPECTEIAAEAKAKGLVPVSTFTLFTSPNTILSEGVPRNLLALTESLFMNAINHGGSETSPKGQKYVFLKGSVARGFGGHPPKDKKQKKKEEEEKKKKEEEEKKKKEEEEKKKKEDEEKKKKQDEEKEKEGDEKEGDKKSELLERAGSNLMEKDDSPLF